MTGGAPWPGMRPEFFTVRRPGHTLIATNGLSNPFDREKFDFENFDPSMFAGGGGGRGRGQRDDDKIGQMGGNLTVAAWQAARRYSIGMVRYGYPIIGASMYLPQDSQTKSSM